jgi:hypothetical protein
LSSWVVAAFLLFGGIAFGTVVACDTSAPGSNLNSFGGTPSDGCAEIDKSFTNLTVTGTVGGAPGTGAIFIYANGTPPVGNTIGPVSLIFNTQGNSWSVSNGASMSETIGYQLTANTGGTYSGGTYPIPSTPGLIWAIDQIVLTPNISITNFGGGTSNTATITLAFCLSATTTSGCSPSHNGMIVANYAGTTTAAYTCTFSGCVSGSSNTINLTGPITQIAFSESLSLSAATPTGNTVTINQIANQFGEFAASPVAEPATRLLVGVGLICIAWFGQRVRSRRPHPKQIGRDFLT